MIVLIGDIKKIFASVYLYTWEIIIVTKEMKCRSGRGKKDPSSSALVDLTFVT